MIDIQQRLTTSFNPQGLMATLGARHALVSDGEVHIALPYSERLSQQHGYVLAGAITSIVDSACGYAALTKAAPGLRAEGGEGFYAAYFRDLDGNKLDVFCYG